MKVQERILLPSRYGTKNYLILKGIDGDEYTYYLESEFPYVRIIYGDEKNSIIEAVDPDSGPFMTIGYEIDGLRLDRIVSINEMIFKDAKDK